MSVTIIDDFLPTHEFQALQEMALSTSFPWYFQEHVAYDDEDPSDNFMFTHLFYHGLAPRSEWFNSLYSVLLKVDPSALVRVLMNLGTPTSEHQFTGYHTDFEFPCTTAILYLNTNNGYTLFEDGTRIESVANRFVEFDSQMRHGAVTQTDIKNRIVINFNYFK